jgi:hypothetical protein
VAIKIELEPTEWVTVLRHLGQGQYVTVAPLIENIRKQMQAATAPPEPPMPPVPPEPPPSVQ